MPPLTRTLLVAITGWMAGVGLAASAQTLPLEIRQPETPWNFRSLRGVPLSSVVGVPLGSDGRMTNRNESGSALLPTTNQFSGIVAFSGSPGLTSARWLAASNSAALKAGNGVFSPGLATEMGLPLGLSNGVPAIVFRRFQIGAPYLTRQVSFPFGSIVEAPTTDENGLPLGAAASTYWLPEPYSTNGHTNAPYYWSPHSGKVYAIQSGPIAIRWVKAAYSPTQPADYAANPANYYVNGGNYFRLVTANYLVSGTPVKPPRRMYWTEREFRLLGKPIAVPTARVGAVNIVYNDHFPRTVASEYKGPGQTSPTDGTTSQSLPELRTLWYDQQQGNIYAYNQEGRVFVELLGDSRANGLTRESLGFEIVNVLRQPTPLNVRTELGERLLPPAPGSLDGLTPEPVLQVAGPNFAYTHAVEGKDTVELYATRETGNLNDYLVHWMETGLEGLKWPSLLGRYELVWPSDPARYSHYVRPFVASEAEARLTAVTLPTANVPVIEYQDPLDQPRAKLTESYQFYTFLDAANPLHRTLLRFSAGDRVAFERVLSWLDVNLKSSQFADSPIARQLEGWNSTHGTLQFADALAAPRVIQSVAPVGRRLEPPTDEPSSGEGYLAGHIRVSEGDLYDPNAYIDPFVDGFETARRGAIIPVNVVPGKDHLEVWWFRSNAADTRAGFQSVHWPSVIARYQLRWPPTPREIVLAANDGSGPLDSLQAQGTIYIQNDRSQPGYNPNEEHALLQGGQAWALRDDLNLTTGPDYSSEPYVLLSYQAEDGRPAMEAFHVIREKGFDTFNYPVEAGTVLQPPMPLPLLEKPLGPKVIGSEPRSLNEETYYRTVSASGSPAGGATAELTTQETHHFRAWFRELALQSPDRQTVRWFLPTNADYGSRKLQGMLSNQRAIALGPVIVPALATNLVLTDTFAPPGIQSSEIFRRYVLTVTQPLRYTLPAGLTLAPGQKVFVVVPPLGTTWEATPSTTTPGQLDVNLVYSETLETMGEVLTFASDSVATPISAFRQGLPSPEILSSWSQLFLPAGNTTPGQFVNWRLRTEPVPASGLESQGAFTLQDRKGNVWVYRGPHADRDPSYLVMQFYYRTMPGFFFPSLPLVQQPPAGTITPYLRNRQPDGTYIGDPVYGNRNGSLRGDDNALAIAYRPVWPASAPVLQMAETLTVPKRSLPAVRGQTSLQIVYQQSQVTDPNRVSVRLHDPTREKEFELGAPGGGARLGRIPDSIRTETVRGLTFFPTLPPHLAQRFFLDPNRGPYGKLVFQGEFVNETVGDSFLQLNVLSSKDAATLSDLCLASDPARDLWNGAIAGLQTRLETFVESPQKPGTYTPNENARVVGPDALAEVTDDDQAVDSYALTAVGPGKGYVTLIAGDGLAFTPRSDPVSVLVLRVSDVLYPGELKIVQSSNPLSEQLTLQQVVDLAGRPGDYEFQWKIAAPVDGLPPRVYQATPKLLLGDGTWQHLAIPWGGQDGVLAASTSSGSRTVPVTLPGSGIVAIDPIPYNTTYPGAGLFLFQVPPGTSLARGNRVMARSRFVANGSPSIEEVPGIVTGVTRLFTSSSYVDQVFVDFGRTDFHPLELQEAPGAAVNDPNSGAEALPQSTVFREFTVPPGTYSQLWLSLDLDTYLGARVYLNGEPVVVANRGSDDTVPGSAPSGFNALPRAYALDPSILSRGRSDGTHRVAVELFSTAAARVQQRFNLRLEAYEAVDQTGLAGTPWLDLDRAKFPDGVRTVIGEAANVRALSDNYLVMRYRATNTTHAAHGSGWSSWTTPQLAEGWIKRVLAGINPFNQRVTDLFNNRVNTDASLLSAAGRRWEGDVALNLESINDYGLVEIYETVLRRGRLLSVDAGINYGPANDALLLAAGYLNDLYTIVGNEAWADAANPTIGIGTASHTYSDIATALFAFKGQASSVLEEELALLRGRDAFLQPGVQTSPVYNRLVWNYTRGIDAGEVIYAINYNIQENPDREPDGVIDAADAARMYPQGHGDAYGHYLTALKGYYSLLLNRNFDWVPRIEAVTVLGQPVSVDYQDERKFAAAAAAVARAGRQIMELTWRQDGASGHDDGWSRLSTTRVNTRQSLPTTRYWGVDHWASRTALGGYVHWVFGNAILPSVDPDPTHEGIQKVDRTTVPELKELATLARDLQSALEGAEGGLTPLGLPMGSLALDLNPNSVVGGENGSHFEQIYGRAKVALNNAVAAFDDAKDVTRLMRSEQDSLADFQAAVARQELAYENALVELYGTPYTDDIGPAGTYRQGYTGPDLVHYAYTERPQQDFPDLLSPELPQSFRIDIQTLPADYGADDRYGLTTKFDFIRQAVQNDPESYRPGIDYVEITLDSNGAFRKPADWTGRRASPGQLQEAIGRIHLAHAEAVQTLASHAWMKRGLDRAIQFYEASTDAYDEVHRWDVEKAGMQTSIEGILFALRMYKVGTEVFTDRLKEASEAAIKSLPDSQIFGLATGGDFMSPVRSSIYYSYLTAKQAATIGQFAKEFTAGAVQLAKENTIRLRDVLLIQPLLRDVARREQVMELDNLLGDLQGGLYTINQKLQKVDDAVRNYQSLVARGDRLQAEREVYRRRTSAVIQGYRTRDAAFRFFRNEKLERYQSLFDLAARYAFLAANAYDYETGLLDTPKGRGFIQQILGARALGVVRGGEPQYAGSNTGDPGLSSALAEMKADWDVVRGRLGINRPDAYGTTVSLRTENFRILASTNGDANWMDVLQRGRLRDVLADQDVRRHCLQIQRGDGQPVPGIVLEFATTITKGQNLFGRDLAAGDHSFGATAFATKIFGVGVALEGYRGMDQPAANAGAGGASAADPGSWFLDPLGLAANPDVYLVPVGVDFMRTPPLGDADDVRGWSVEDVAIPLPFNIGAVDAGGSTPFASADSLAEPLFAVRRHQGFRPVPSSSFFSSDLYTSSGTLQRSTYTNNRLIGRSAWNSRWKLVIPGHTLLQDPDEGLERLIRTVRDIKLHFVTYSYSGN